MGKKNYLGWTLDIAFYPGILFGIRAYEEEERLEHVLYIPFVGLILSIYYEN